MKSLIKIVRRYIGMAFFIMILVLFLNLLLYGSMVFEFQKNTGPKYSIKQITDQFHRDFSELELTKEGYAKLESQYSFAMLLNEQGQIIWQYQLPRELDKTYSLQAILSMTRWYLEDYPVNVWDSEYGIFIAGNSKNSVAKYSLEIPMELFHKAPQIIGLIILSNLLLILLLCFLLGRRLLNSLRPLAQGVERLSRNERAVLPEKGMTAELAHQINETSGLLDKQSQYLKKRDTARTNWIAGVSHDIRTPLSIIIGNAEELEADDALSKDVKVQIALIKEQSIQIKSLIEDLNLTSKLEYDMQPLRLEEYSPGALLRQNIAALMNQGLGESYEIDLRIEPEVERVNLQGDVNLMQRAFANLIRNSLRHNKDGCNIEIHAAVIDEELCICFADDGMGIPGKVLDSLAANSKPETLDKLKKPENQPHIMGLLIVRQIVKAHGGRITFASEQGAGCQVTLYFPLSEDAQ